MYSGYENWLTRGIDELEKHALTVILRAWLADAPLDATRVLHQLKRSGFDVEAADKAINRLRASDPAPELLRNEVLLAPTLAAAIHLRELPELRELLDILERLVAHLHNAYDPDGAVPDHAQVAARIGTTESQLRRAMRLWRGNETLQLDPAVLHWTSYERFLERELRRPWRAPTARAPEPMLPIDLTAHRIRWLNVGPFTRASTLELAPMTFLVGSNATGKTSALAVLAAMRSLASDGLTATSLGRRLREGADEFMVGLDVTLRRPIDPAPRALTWQLVAGLSGHLHARAEAARSGPDELATFERGAGHWLTADGRLAQHTMRPDQLAMNVAAEVTSLWPLIALRQQLARWWIELSPPQHRAHGLEPRWQPYRQAAAARARLLEIAGELVGVRDLAVSDDDVTIDDGRHRGPLEIMPRGMVRALEILAVVLAPAPPPLFAIDELENHLHGDLAARLLDVLRSVSHRTQIVVTTHSARVLRAARPDEVQLCHRTPHGSAIAPLRAYPHLVHLAEAGDLGALIEGNYFAGTP